MENQYEKRKRENREIAERLAPIIPDGWSLGEMPSSIRQDRRTQNQIMGRLADLYHAERRTWQPE